MKNHNKDCLVYDTNGGICSCGASKDHWDCDPPCELHRQGGETS